MVRVDRMSREGKALFRRISASDGVASEESLRYAVNLSSKNKELTPYDKQQLGKLFLQSSKTYIRQPPRPTHTGYSPSEGHRFLKSGGSSNYLANEKTGNLFVI